jgi:glycerol-1-phosphatase
MTNNEDAGVTDMAVPGAERRAARMSPALAPRGCADPLSEAYDVALLDLDGVVYVGSAAVPGAAEALREAGSRGMRHAFVTNNASRTPAAIAAQLTRLGVPAAARDVVTSGQAAARLLARRLPAGARVLVVGGNGLRIALRERGLRPVSAAAERPAAVVQGFSPDLSYALLAEGALAVSNGALFVAANADRTLPTARGAEMGNGSLVQAIIAATGQRPVVAGKPEPPLHAEAVHRTGARRPLVVGDRLDTDIEGAVRAGADSLLVLTGVSGPADVLLAPAAQRPTYLAADLAGLLEPHPEVTAGDGTAGDGTAQCGGWTARLDSDRKRLDLTGSGEAIDGLRALCGAAWPSGRVTAEMAEPALAELGFAG